MKAEISVTGLDYNSEHVTSQNLLHLNESTVVRRMLFNLVFRTPHSNRNRSTKVAHNIRHVQYLVQSISLASVRRRAMRYGPVPIRLFRGGGCTYGNPVRSRLCSGILVLVVIGRVYQHHQREKAKKVN